MEAQKIFDEIFVFVILDEFLTWFPDMSNENHGYNLHPI